MKRTYVLLVLLALQPGGRGRQDAGSGAAQPVAVESAPAAATMHRTAGAPADLRPAVRRLRQGFVRLLVDRPLAPAGPQDRRTIQTTVSGLRLDDAGHVLTVGDAIEGAVMVSAEDDDGALSVCEFVGYDPQTNVGVVRTHPKEIPDWTAVGAVDVAPGLPVFALGNPFGLGTTVSAGWVTGTARTIESRGYELADLLQLSLAINPGDQGGPVADLDGRLVGMLLTRYRPVRPPGPDGMESSEEVEPHGISFAIPVGKARAIAERLVEAHAAWQRDPKRSGPWLGVRALEIESDALRAQLRLEPDQGVLIERVYTGSPAEVAGIRPNDVVLRFGAEPLAGLQHFGTLVRSTGVGACVTVEVLREGRRIELDLVIGVR